MLALRRRWAGLSILNKAIVLSCTFVIPILLVVGLLLNDFYAYRKESDVFFRNICCVPTTWTRSKTKCRCSAK